MARQSTTLDDVHNSLITLSSKFDELRIAQQSQRVLLDTVVAGHLQLRKDMNDFKALMMDGFEVMNGRFDRVEDHVDHIEGLFGLPYKD